MASTMEQLVVLQERDMEIARLRKALDEIPLRKQQIEARLQAQGASLEIAEGALAAAGLKLKALEGEVEALKEKIAKYRTQQMQIKSNEEYKALEKEIALAQSEILAREDAQLAAMEALDAAKVDVAARKADYAQEKTRVDADVAAFLGETEVFAKDLAVVEEERRNLAVDIDADSLARYERILAKQKNRAISIVEHGTCGECHMKLSPAQVLDSRKTDSMTPCAFCGRILYSR